MGDEAPVTVVNMEALLSRLLNNEYIPPAIRDSWWILSSDDIILSNFDEQGIEYMKNQFDLLENRTVRALPGHDYDTDMVILINSIKMIYYSKLMRAKKGFTATNLVRQVQEQYISDRTNQPVAGGSGGFLGMVKGLLGRS